MKSLDSNKVDENFDSDEFDADEEMRFNLLGEDDLAIQVALNSAYALLNKANRGTEIVGLGIAIHALKSMPSVIDGCFVNFEICYRYEGEFTSVGFEISDEKFEISRYTYSEESSGWLVERAGYRDCSCDLHSIEDEISELFNLGGEFSVTYATDFDLGIMDPDTEDGFQT